MADTAAEIPINIEESVIEAVKNGTEKVPATIEGLAIAYLSLVIMAILPIFFGSFRSVKYLKEQKVSCLIILGRTMLVLSHVLIISLAPMRMAHVRSPWHILSRQQLFCTLGFVF